MVGTFSEPPLIVTAGDDLNFSVETLEILPGHFLPGKGEIPQVVDDIVWTNCLIPVLYQPLIHLRRRGKGAIAVPDHVFVTEVSVRGEPGLHNCT